MRRSISAEMVGKTIKQVAISKDKSEITFTFAEGEPLTLEAYGDCCSHTYIESIDVPDNLLGVVRRVENVDMPEPRLEKDDFDVTDFYGLRIVTDKGHAIIDYRNDNNGYYGGSLIIKGCSDWETMI